MEMISLWSLVLLSGGEWGLTLLGEELVDPVKLVRRGPVAAAEQALHQVSNETHLDANGRRLCYCVDAGDNVVEMWCWDTVGEAPGDYS